MLHRQAVRKGRRFGTVSRVLIATGLVTTLSTSFVTFAAAEDRETLADTAAARSLGVEGVKLADAGRCSEAVDKLSRAEKLHHATTILARLGECQVALGKLVDGTENLQRVLREPIPVGAPAVFVKARDRAQTVLDGAKPKIAKLVLAIRAPREVTPTVAIDGQSASNLTLESERPTDPGEHVVEASAPGFLKTTSKFTLAEAERRSVTLVLEVDPNAATAIAAVEPPQAGGAPGRSTESAAASSTPTAPPNPPSASQPAPSHLVSYVLWGVGIAGVAVGTGFGVAAMGAKSDLDTRCANKVCPNDAQSDIDAAKLKGTISTVGFGVGVLGLGLGTVLYFTGSEGRDGAASVRIGRTAVRVSPWVSADRGGVTGSF